MSDAKHPMFAIPEELRLLKQWICWRYEDGGGKKPTKVPYNAIKHTLANVNDSTTFTTFEDTFNAYNIGNYSGIGFVFTNNDPYAFIDLDSTEGNQIDQDRQLKIFKEFDSYSEISPSGQGLHIIVKGSIPQGRRRNHIEIYSSERYATMTGNAYPANEIKPIANRHDLLNQLFNQMGGSPITSTYTGDAQETNTDEEIIKQASDATNGDKFLSLYSGGWQNLYPSQSEADLAIIDIIAFYTQNRNQVSRIFLSSVLGNRDKAKRKDYISWMINKSFDRMPPKIDIDGFKIALDNKLAGSSNGKTLVFDTNNDGSIPSPTANSEPFLPGIGPVAQSAELVPHKNLVAGSNPAGTTTNLKEYIYGNIQGMDGHSKNSPNEHYISKEISGQEQNKDQRIQQRMAEEPLAQDASMASRIQNNSEMRDMPGNTSGLPRLSSQRPETENNENINNGGRNSQSRSYQERNSQMYGDMRQLSPQATLQRTITVPQGLMGEIAQFIYAAAPRPVPEIALAASIGLMAGICGKAYNVSGTGLNQYVLMLAMTGAGKEAMASGIDKLINAVQRSVPVAPEFIGPSRIASGQALYRYLSNKSQCFVSIIGEFGLRIEAMSKENANTSEKNLKTELLDLYNKSGFGQVARPSIYADSDKNTLAIASPSFSILGESTPETFYRVLNEEMINEGLLPRFMLIEYTGPRPDLNPNHLTTEPPIFLVDKVAQLMVNSKTLMAGQKVINIQYDPEALKMLNDFDKLSDSKINTTDKEAIRQLWNRAHIKTLKIAGLIAVGVNYINPLIMPEYVLWAINMVEHDIITLSSKFDKGEIGKSTEELKQFADMKRIIKQYLTEGWEKASKYGIELQYHSSGIIPQAYIGRRLAPMASFKNDRMGATIAIKRTIATMIDEGFIVEVGKKQMLDQFRSSQRAFVLTNMKLIDND